MVIDIHFVKVLGSVPYGVGGEAFLERARHKHELCRELWWREATRGLPSGNATTYEKRPCRPHVTSHDEPVGMDTLA